MQNINKKASILIWAFFLSSVIIISFISISFKINKTIKNNMTIEKNIKINSLINQKIKSKDFINENIWNKKIIFENNKFFTWSLEKNKNINLNLSWVNKWKFDLKILNWWPLYYEFLSYSWAVNSAKQITASWIVYTSSSFNWELNNKFDKAKLEIKNLWWFTNFTLSWSINFLWEYKKYKIIKKIWNKEIIEKSWEIKIQ